MAILSGKGGTGKSIIAASLAYVLANCGFKTLLVDVDLFTGGLSFYVLAEYPAHRSVALQNIFLGVADQEFKHLRPTPIPNEFCEKNLFLLPAIASKARRHSELVINSQFQSVDSFSRTLQEILTNVNRAQKFDYILIDTRGGTDLTSVGSALVADGFIVVTEADKTSWDVGEVLFAAIHDAQKETSHFAHALGFILNKNVLPPEAIVAFLKQRWECPHLATLPLDENAIRFYQEDRVPIAADPTCPFSAGLIPIVRKLFVSEAWAPDNTYRLGILENRAKQAAKLRVDLVQLSKKVDRASFTIRLYSTALVCALMAYFIFIFYRLGNSAVGSLLLTVAPILIVLITVTEPRILFGVIKLLSALRWPNSKKRSSKGSIFRSKNSKKLKKTGR